MSALVGAERRRVPRPSPGEDGFTGSAQAAPVAGFHLVDRLWLNFRLLIWVSAGKALFKYLKKSTNLCQMSEIVAIVCEQPGGDCGG